jgi:tRNA threonylcarbamoyladenosine biosynthesis protein TsaB
MPTPRLLLLETSHQPGFVALAEGEHLDVVRLDEARRHARDLAPTVRQLLSQRNLKPRDIQAVVVGRGPGSYTGLRVGVMSAKTFAYATGCNLLGLDTFAVIAAQAPPEVARLAVLADAQQDKVYVQEFERDVPLTLLSIMPFQDWLQAASKPLWLSGPGLNNWGSHSPADVKLLDKALWDPQPETMLRLGLARHERGERDDIWSIEPIYLRPSAAEEQWAKRK